MATGSPDPGWWWLGLARPGWSGRVLASSGVWVNKPGLARGLHLYVVHAAHLVLLVLYHVRSCSTGGRALRGSLMAAGCHAKPHPVKTKIVLCQPTR